MQKFELALDTSKWIGKSPEYLIEDLASAILEFERKINPYWLDLKGIKNLKERTLRDIPIFEREFQALEEIEQWLLNESDRYYAWISSACELYPTSRVIVGKKFTEGTVRTSLNRALCIANTPADCLHIANRLNEFSAKCVIFTNPEQLRSQIITFNLPENTSLSEFLLQILGYTPEVEKIQTGLDMQGKMDARKEAKIVVSRNYHSIQNTPRGITQIYLGASIEEQLLQRDHKVNRFGDCPGKTNTEVLGELGAFDTLYQNINSPAPNKTEYSYTKEGVCQMCNKLKMVCPPPQGCNVCEDCTVADNIRNSD